MDIRIRRDQTTVVIALAICAAVMAGLGATRASAASTRAEPPTINHLVTATTELNRQQRDQIADYARYWSSALLSSDMEQSRRAKRRLSEPFGVLGIRRIFRDEYSRAAIPELNKALNSDNLFAAVNAIQVVAEFRNEAALGVMRERCGPSREPRWQVRLWAARGVGRIASSAEDIPSRTIDAAVRELVRAGESETNWMVLQPQFEALAAISSERSREGQLTLLNATLARIAEDTAGPSELMQPVHRALLLLRNQLLDPNLSSTELRSLGTEAGPLLGQVLEIGVLHWETANTDDRIRASYDGAIAMAENLLELIDAQVRGANVQRPRLTTTWGNGNKSNFEADVARWRQVLGAPPYARR